MSYQKNCFCVALCLLALGCSDDPQSPSGSAVTAADILSAPVETIKVDGQDLTLHGSYFVVAEGEPLHVLASLSDQDVKVEELWFLSDGHLEGDNAPQSCFVPNRSCVSHVTRLSYELGTEFVVAVDFRDSQGELVRVRSVTITVLASPPLFRSN